MKKVVLARPLRSARNTAGSQAPLPPSKEGVGRGDLSGFSTDQEKEREEDQDLLAHLIAESSRLDLADVKRLYEHLALELMAPPSDSRDVDMWAHAVYQALARALGTQGGGLPGPLAIKRLLSARSAWAPVDGFMRDAKLADLMVAQRQAIYVLLASLLVDLAIEVARHAHIPVSAKLVANNAVNLAALVERSFPGYVRSGMFAAIALRQFAGQAPDQEER